jgi:hypothetical protein
MSEMLIDFRRLSLPENKYIIQRNKKIEKLKELLGDKYLLAKCMPKLQKGNK